MPTLFDLHGIDLASDAPAPPQKTGLARRALGDTGVSLMKGVIGVPEALVGLADIPTGGYVGKAAESLGFRPKDAKASLDELYSPEQQAANREVQQAQGFVDTTVAAVRNPSTILQSAVESAPSLLPAGAVARGALTLLPRIGGAVAAGIGEGAVSAGQTAEQVRQETANGLLTGQQSALAGASGVLTGLIGGVAGKIANRLGIGDIDQLVAGVQQAGPKAQKSLARALMEGFATEGVLQELPQSAQEQIAQNVALGKPWDEGVGNAAAMGALAGGAMGAGAAPFGHSSRPTAPVVPTAEESMNKLATADNVGDMIASAQELANAPLDIGAPAAAGLSPDQEDRALTAMERQMQADQQGIKFGGPRDAGPAQPVPVQRSAAATAPAAQASAQFIDTPPLLDRLETLNEQLRTPEVRETVRARLGDDALNTILYYTQQAGRPDGANGMPAATRERIVTLAETILGRALLQPTGSPAQAPGIAPQAFGREALTGQPAPAVPQLEADTRRTGTMRVDRTGVVTPETRLDAINTGQAVQRGQEARAAAAAEASTIEPQGRRASAVYGEGRPKRPAPPVQMPERRRTDPIDLAPVPVESSDPVLDYVERMRQVATPQARAFVQDFRAGRITRRDVIRVMQSQGQDPLSPEQRLADAAAQAPVPAAGGLEVPTVYRSRTKATVEANKVGGKVVPVEGGFTVEEVSGGERDAAGSGGRGAADVGAGRGAARVVPVGGLRDAAAAPAPGDEQRLASRNDGPGSDGALIDQAANEAATSPANELPEPTQAQKEAGNYKVGRIRVAGLDISIENPRGSTRSGIDRDGKAWQNTLQHHYGYIRGTVGADKDHVDVFVKPGTPEDFGGPVFVVDQVDPSTGKFDEHKALIGFDNEQEARDAYAANYAKGWKGLKSITAMPVEEFKAWVKDPKQTGTPLAKETSQSKKSDRLTDAGEELIRNRRGKLKGLAWDDVSGMNDTLKVAQVVKTNVWPRPDYAKMVADGAPAWKAAMLKVVYDKIAVAPVTRSVPTDADLQAYIETVNKVREALTAELDRVEKLGGSGDLWKMLRSENVFGKVFPVPVDARAVYGRPSPFDRGSEQGKENNRRAMMAGGNSLVQALQFSSRELMKVKDLLADGFPAKQEAWQKSYEVRAAETRDNDIPEAERTGEPQQRFYVYEKGSRWRLAKGGQDGGYASQELAEAFARSLVVRKRETLPPSRGLELGAATRTGPDWRNGRDVTAEEVMQHFGFRGVNLGEYVKAKQNVAQLHLNHVFDAFNDLADVLGVPPKAMSLDGTLGVAIGAQGSGKALAHFVPGVNEINITRDSGAGALAHEFGHALDHYLATQHGQAASMSKRPYLSAVAESIGNAGGVRPDLMAAMRAVMKTINTRPMTEAEAKQYIADQRALNQRRLDRWIEEFKGNRGADKAALDAVAEKLKRGDLGEPQDTDVETNLAEMMRAANLTPGNAIGAQAFTIAYRLADLADEARFMASHIPQVPTNYARASDAMDAKKQSGDGYWSTPWEKFARAFETFAMDALRDRQRESLYLSGLVDSEGWRKWSEETGKSIPFPAGEERLQMQQAFQQLVDAIQTRDTERGVAIFSRRADADRAALRWVNTEQNTEGPEYYGRDVSLISLLKMDTQDEFAENSLPLGHTVHVREGNTAHKFLITDNDGGVLGEAYLEVNPDGQIDAVHDIEMTDKRAGAGRKVMAAILANADGPVRIIDILDQSDAFWQKMGAGYKDTYGNATTDWESYRAAQGADARGSAGARSAPAGELEAGRAAEGEPGSGQESEVGPKANRLVELLRGSSGKGYPIRLAEIAARQYEAAGLHRVNVARNFDDLPAQLRAKLSGFGDDVRGAYFPSTDQIYVFTDNITSPDELHFVVMHEAFHRGLGAMFGDQSRQLLRQMYASNQRLRERADLVARELKISRDEAIEEALADMAGEGKAQSLRGWKRLASMIRNWLRSMAQALGLQMQFTDAQIETFVAGVARAGINTDPAAQGEADGLDVPQVTTGVDLAAASRAEPQFSRTSPLAGINQQAIRDALADRFKSAGEQVNWWQKTLGTQYDKAKAHPEYGKVFRHVQQYIEDTSMLANEAADQAPDILPKLESVRDVFAAAKRGLSTADQKAVAAPIFEGTLNWSRQGGKLVKFDDLQAQAEQMSTAEKERVLFRDGKVTETELKRWKATPLDIYEGAIRNRYAQEYLQPGVVFSPAELQQLFGLNEAQVGVYQQFRAAVNESLDQVASADALRLLGEATPEIRAAAMGNRAGFRAAVEAHLQDRIKAEDDANKREQLQSTLADIVEKFDRVDQLKGRGYAPLMRFGKYFVSVKGAEGQQEFFGLYETRAEANRMARDLGADDQFAGRVEQGTMSQEAFKLFSGIPVESLEMFADAIGAEQSAVYQEWLRLTKNNRSALKRLIKRKGTEGFSSEVTRVLASFVTSNARLAAGAMNMPQAKEAAEQIRAGDIKDEGVKLIEAVQNPTDTAGVVRGLMFAHFIGGSVASALVNVTQPVMMTLPWLSQWGGPVKAAARLMASARQAAGGKITDTETAEALKRAEKDGIVSPQEIHHLTAEAMASWGKNPVLKRAAFLWGAPFSVAEQFNRRVTFLAAYATAKAEGMADPFAFAHEAVVETQGLYNKGNAPNWARNPIGATALTFKQYSIHYLEWIKRMWNAGEPGSRERTEGRKAVLFAMALLFMAGGSEGLPFAEDVNDLADTVMQALGFDTSAKGWKREFLGRTLGMGDTGADVVMRGLSALPGIPLDVSMRMGMGNLLPGTGMLMKSNTDVSGDVLELAGPVGAMVKQYKDAGRKALDGNLGDAALGMLPGALQNVGKAATMWIDGEARDGKGRRVMATDEIDAVMKLIGFQPAELARENAKISEQDKRIKLARVVESSIADQWAQGLRERDVDMVNEARQQLADWNATNPESRIAINSSQVKRRLKEMQTDKADRFTRTAPKEMRGSVSEALR